MPTNKIDSAVVREIAKALPGVKEGSLHGAPSFKVSGRLLACPALHKSAEPDSLMVRVSFEQRAALLVADPDVYYVTEHYAKHPAVLVRLGQIKRSALKKLLEQACYYASSNAK